MWCTIVGCRFFYVGIPNRTGVLTVGNSNRTVARRRRNRVITIRGLFFCGDGHPSTLSYYFYHHHTETFLYPIIIICLQPVAAHNFSWFLVPRTTFCTFHFRRWSHPLPTWPFSCPTQLYGGTTILNTHDQFLETLKVACPKLTVPTVGRDKNSRVSLDEAIVE